MAKKGLLAMAVLLVFSSLTVWAQGPGVYRRPGEGRSRQHNRDVYGWLHSDDQYLGVRMGYNDASLGLRGCSGVDRSSINGLNVGLVYGVRMSYDNPVFFETGLLYSGKGAKLRKSTDHYSIRMHMLEVPLVFKYKIETDVPELSVQPFAGGFVSAGVGGRYKDFQEREKHSTFHKGSFQSFDIGFRLGCGLQYEVFYAELSYDIGMANMASSDAYNLAKHLNYDDFDDKIRTGCLSLTLGVNF